MHPCITDIIIFDHTGHRAGQSLAGDSQRKALIHIGICESVGILLRNSLQSKVRLLLCLFVGWIPFFHPMGCHRDISSDIRLRRHLLLIKGNGILIAVIGNCELFRHPGASFFSTIRVGRTVIFSISVAAAVAAAFLTGIPRRISRFLSARLRSGMVRLI